MKNSKIFVVFATLGLAGAAFAQYSSPEMLMVTDSGGTLANGTVTPAQVERYDPYTGAYLGAFGAGYLGTGIPDGISIIGQDAYVTDLFSVGTTEYSRIMEFNFSTGAYDGTVFNSAPYQLVSTSSYGGNLITADYGNSAVSGTTGAIYTLSPTGQEIGVTSLPSGVVTKGATVVGNQLWVTTVSNSTTASALYVYNLNANGTINGAPTKYGGAGNQYTSVVTTTVNGTQYVYTGGYNSTGTNGLIDKWTTAGTFWGEQAITGFPYGAYSLAAGHNGIIYGFNAAGAGTGVITRYDGGNSFGLGSLGTFTLSETGQGQNIAVYAAPEPVSMTLLGLGAIGLIARRRRKN